MKNIAINGFGRVGRQVLKVLLDKYSDSLNVVAINDLTDTKTLAYLLKYDSVHGKYPGDIGYDDHNLIIDSKAIRVLSEKEPSKLPWTEMNIDFVLESTGHFRTRDLVLQHINAGAKRVLLSAPAKDELDATIVLGVNDTSLTGDEILYTNASCTTNAAATLLKIVHDNFTVKRATITAIHAYTNDQSLHDQPHRELRRARAAAISLIPTTTGSSTDITKVIPDLKDKLTSIAVRTPNICGSLTDCVIETEKETTVAEVNQVFQHAAQTSHSGILEYTEDPIVSVDIIGNPSSCIFDSQATQVVGGKGNLIKIMGWFDNEMGYSNRCADLFALMARSY